MILVGSNGSGKTNFISLVADAIFEAAAAHYEDVLPTKGLGRTWFRVVGGRTITVGETGSFSILRFADAGVERFYKEKAGHVDPASARLRVPTNVQEQVVWPVDDIVKEFTIDDESSRTLFQKGVYTYFPSSRSEIPHWLNKNSVEEVEFEVVPRFSKTLRRPIFVERAINSFKQWVIGLLSDCRTEIVPVESPNGTSWSFNGNPAEAQQAAHAVRVCNSLLRLIFNDDEVRLVWLGSGPIDVSVAI